MLLKVELHSHTSDDPVDRIPHSAFELIDHAATLAYHALAITLHEKQLDLRPLMPYAATRGVVLIPGLERTIEGRHVLLLNFSLRAESVTSFEALARLRKEESGLVIAPHPFYPLRSCVGSLLDRHAAVFDAVEVNAMYAPGVNFNEAAIRRAARHRKPLVGNGDIHRLAQLGTTYSLVDADPDPKSIGEAVRAGKVDVRTKPLSWARVVAILGRIGAADILQALHRNGATRATTHIL